MSSDLSAPCLRCGVPAPPHGEHHHPHKGMGGQGAKVAEHPRVVLCRGCHNAVHLGEFTLTLDGDVATGSENGMVTFERGMVVRDEGDDSRFWSDERLAQQWSAGEESALRGLASQCEVAHEFYRRYRSQERWYERVAEIISDNNGTMVGWRDVYRRVRLYEAFGDNWGVYQELGKTLALAAAETREPKEAVEIALTAKAAGHRVADIMPIMRERDHAAAATPPARHSCPDCGANHIVKGKL